MLESEVFLENKGDGDGSVSDGVRNQGGSGGAVEDCDRNSARNRWSRDETLALVKVRSDMDLAFRDSNLKAPLWDEVSRKLGELGYQRSAKKCKEKFENIFKYHKRTKECRSSNNSKNNYMFFEQLELFDTQLSVPSPPLDPAPSYTMETITIAMTTLATTSEMANPINCSQDSPIPCSFNQDLKAEFMSASTSTVSSSGKESEGSIKKKRKLADYFERLMKDVLKKQEDLQNKFLEAIEKSEKDRMIREEAWKAQEMSRIKREQEYIAQVRAIATAKDAALLAFLQKITQQATHPLDVPEIFNLLFDNPAGKRENILENLSILQENGVAETCHTEKQNNSAAENITQTSSSRWPKAEVEALIMLKTDLDLKYQDNGPKGPLWEEISSCMKKLGYERSAKRCKEKWENMKYYYKRVKYSNKRSEDSKTCTYFNMLEYLYAKKSNKSLLNSDNDACNLKPAHVLMQMISQNQQQPQEQLSMGEYGDGDPQNQGDDAEDDQFDDSGDGYNI